MSNAVSGGDVHVGIISKILRLFKFIAISYVISFVFIVALSVIICYTDVPESVSTPAVKIITFFGVFISAFMHAARASGRGWLVGGITGIANIIILWILGFVFAGGDVFSAADSLQLLCGFLFGAVGGIFGINISGK